MIAATKSFLLRGRGFFLFFLVQVSQCNIFIWALLATELQYLTFGSFCIHDMCVYGARAWLKFHWCLCLLKSTLVISYVYSWVGGSALVLLVRYSTDTMNVSHLRGKSDTSQNLSPICTSHLYHRKTNVLYRKVSQAYMQYIRPTVKITTVF